MARQNFNEMDPLGFRWEIHTEVAIPLSKLAGELDTLSDEEVLNELRGRTNLDLHGLFDPRYLISVQDKHNERPGDRIQFDRMGKNDKEGRVVYSRIVSQKLFRIDLIKKVQWGIHAAHHRLHDPGMPSLRPVLHNKSRSMKTSFKITHVQHPEDWVPSFPGSAIGLDSAWRVFVGKNWSGEEPTMRSICTIRDVRVETARKVLDPELQFDDYWKPEEQITVVDRRKPACWSDEEAMWITGIPNGWLFNQFLTADPEDHRNRGEDLASMFKNTDVFLGLYNRPISCLGDDLWLVQPLLKLLQSPRTKLILEDDGGKTKILYRRHNVGEWDQSNGRIQFSPTQSYTLWSCPIEKKEIPAALAALILDAAWAWEILDDGRHLSSFLGPLAEDYPDLTLTANYRLRLDDDRGNRTCTLSQFKRRIHA